MSYLKFGQITTTLKVSKRMQNQKQTFQILLANHFKCSHSFPKKLENTLLADLFQSNMIMESQTRVIALTEKEILKRPIEKFIFLIFLLKVELHLKKVIS